MPGYNRSRRSRGRGRTHRAQEVTDPVVVVQATYVSGEIGGGGEAPPVLTAELVLRDYPTDFGETSVEVESMCPGFVWDPFMGSSTAGHSLKTDNWCAQFSNSRTMLQHFRLPDDSYVRRFFDNTETLDDFELGKVSVAWHSLGFISRLPLRNFKEQCMIIGIKLVEGMPGPDTIVESYGVPPAMDNKGKLMNCVANMSAYYFARGYKLVHFGNDFHTFYMAIKHIGLPPNHSIVELLGYDDWVNPRMECYEHFYGALYEQWRVDCGAEDCCLHCDITRWTKLWFTGYWQDTGPVYELWNNFMKWHDKHQQQIIRWAGKLDLDRDAPPDRDNVPVFVDPSVRPKIADLNKVKAYWTNSAKKSAQWEHMKWFHSEYEMKAHKVAQARPPNVRVLNAGDLTERQLTELLTGIMSRQ